MKMKYDDLFYKTYWQWVKCNIVGSQGNGPILCSCWFRDLSLWHGLYAEEGLLDLFILDAQ